MSLRKCVRKNLRRVIKRDVSLDDSCKAVNGLNLISMSGDDMTIMDGSDLLVN